MLSSTLVYLMFCQLVYKSTSWQNIISRRRPLYSNRAKTCHKPFSLVDNNGESYMNSGGMESSPLLSYKSSLILRQVRPNQNLRFRMAKTARQRRLRVARPRLMQVLTGIAISGLGICFIAPSRGVVISSGNYDTSGRSTRPLR